MADTTTVKTYIPGTRVEEPIPHVAVMPLAYSIPDAAMACGISRSMIYEAIQNGELKPSKVGARTLIAIEEIRRWLIARQVTEIDEARRQRARAARARRRDAASGGK